jgi:FkbM family methyltransferase
MAGKQTDLVYDIGMNNGDDTAYYLRCGYRVLAVEANPLLAQSASRRFQREIAQGRLTILNVGISQDGAPLPFWICDDHSEWSSFDRTIAGRDGAAHHAIEIRCCRFRDILAEHGTPFYLKIDIEGNDVLCLRDLRAEDLPEYLSVEANGLDILAEMHALGYDSFQCISQFHLVPLENPPHPEHAWLEQRRRWADDSSLAWRLLRMLGARHWLRRSAKRLRRRDNWFFRHGTSGPFGPKLSGRWMSYHDMKQTYQHYEAARARGEPSVFWREGNYSFWSDFHARRSG